MAAEPYEDAAERLAGEATAGPWAADRHRIYVVGPDGKAARGMAVGMWPTVGQGYREDDAALIAYHHPARVVALAAVVRAARAHVAWDWSHLVDDYSGGSADVAMGVAEIEAALAALDAAVGEG